jgi:hypothetical protein
MAFLNSFQLPEFLDFLLSLFAAFVLGTAIGAERQYRQRCGHSSTPSIACLEHDLAVAGKVLVQGDAVGRLSQQAREPSLAILDRASSPHKGLKFCGSRRTC